MKLTDINYEPLQFFSGYRLVKHSAAKVFKSKVTLISASIVVLLILVNCLLISFEVIGEKQNYIGAFFG